ncbi:ABC transporter permease subunit [Streptomyces sp. HUAS MG47]|uniref:ABC transporter permease subunit n=1 Tax=Streptomyces solicamelliae TaxID=3231716 RepID=UPI003877AB73
MTTPPAQQAGAPAPGVYAPVYVSPIPVRRAHLGDALASEWTKIRSVRSTMWTLGVLVLLMVSIGIGVAALVAASGVGTESDPALGLGFFGLLPGSICVITLGVLTIASEYGTGMIRTTLTACPSRGRVLAAKAIVFFLLVFAITTVTATLVAVAQYGLVGGPEQDAGAWLRATVGAGLYIALLGLLSMAVGTIIRHSAGAITIMIGVLLLPLVAGLFMFTESLQGLQEALFTYAVPSQMIALYADVPPFGADGPSGWEPVLILIGVTGLALGAAYAAMRAQDV